MKNYDKLKNTELEDRYRYIESLFNHFKLLELESLKQEIKDKFITNTNDINLLIAIYFAIESKTSNKEFNYYKNIVIDIINNYEDYISILDINLNIYNIKNIDISHLVDSKTILELLYELDIYDIRDLKKLSLECVITVLSSNIKKIAAYLKVIRIDNYLQSIRDIINNCFDNLNTYDRNISIFFERYGITGEALTLENIGTKYSLTRERVRKICMNKYVEVYNKYTHVQEEINTFLLSSFKFNRKYLTKEEVNIKLNDDILTNELCFICDEFDNGIHYEKSCGVFYIKSEITIEELIELDHSSVYLSFEIMEYAHRNQKRVNGEDYANHPARCLQNYRDLVGIKDNDYNCIDKDLMHEYGVPFDGVQEVCLLHDVVEDECFTIDELEEIFNECDLGIYFKLYIKQALIKITHNYNDDYLEYIKICMENPISAICKMMDLQDNLYVLSLIKFDEKNYERASKYLSCLYIINLKYQFIENSNKYRIELKNSK